MHLSFKTILISSAISAVILTTPTLAADKDDAPSGCLACLKRTFQVIEKAADKAADIEKAADIAGKLAPMASAIAVAIDPAHAEQINRISSAVRLGLQSVEDGAKCLYDGEIVQALNGMGSYGIKMAQQFSKVDDKQRAEIAKAVFQLIVDNPALLAVSQAQADVGAAVTPVVADNQI